MNVITEKYKGWTISVDYDEFGDDPTNDGNFKIYMSPDSRVIGKDASEFVDEYGHLTIGARAMLKSGRLWPLHYDERGGQSLYRLTDDLEYANGFIEFAPEYIKGISKDDRREYAKQDLENYTAWANGECYGITVTDPYGADEPDISQWGIIGDYDWAVDEAKRLIDGYGINYAAKAKYAGELHR